MEPEEGMSESDPIGDALGDVMEAYRQRRALNLITFDGDTLAALTVDLEKASGGKVRSCLAIGDEVVAEVIVLDRGYRVRLS